MIKKSVKEGLSKVEKYIDKRKADIVILDEILNVLDYGLISQGELKAVIKKAKNIELILTGRDAPAEIIKLADYVSLIAKIKHPFDKRILARKGIEPSRPWGQRAPGRLRQLLVQYWERKRGRRQSLS